MRRRSSGCGGLRGSPQQPDGCQLTAQTLDPYLRAHRVAMLTTVAPLIRLAARLLIGTNDQWLVAHRYISHASMQLILPEHEQQDCA